MPLEYEDLAFKPAMTWGDLVETNRNKQLFYKNCSDIFDIAPADDWTKSLIKVGGE